MIINPKLTTVVEDYKDFCYTFKFDYIECSDFDETLIRAALNTMEGDYIITYINDNRDGYFIIHKL